MCFLVSATDKEQRSLDRPCDVGLKCDTFLVFSVA